MVNICNSCEINSILTNAFVFDPNKHDPIVCQKDCCGNILTDGSDFSKCTNLVERKIKPNSSKSCYIYKRLSDKFIKKTRYTCTEDNEYNFDSNTLIDNKNKVDYTESQQCLLVNRGIKTEQEANKILTRFKNRHHVPHKLYGRNNYCHLGFDGSNQLTGLPPHLRSGYYFDINSCKN